MKGESARPPWQGLVGAAARRRMYPLSEGAAKAAAVLLPSAVAEEEEMTRSC